MSELVKAIAIHGGAGARNKTQADLDNMSWQREGLMEIVQRGRDMLLDEKPGLSVAVQTLVDLEAHPAFNAGYGASPRVKRTKKGKIKRRYELDAGIMDGETGEYAAVAGVTVMQHPSIVAYEVLRNSRYTLFAGNGANRLAKKVAGYEGIPVLKNSLALETPYRRTRFEEWLADQENQPEKPLGDTVGVLVFDGKKFVAASSTGGPLGVELGRVGDLFVPGAGMWATDYGAACVSGNGEDIIYDQVARKAVEGMPHNDDRSNWVSPGLFPIDNLQRVIENRSGGVIGLNRSGDLCAAKTTKYMPLVYWRSGTDQPISYQFLNTVDFN